MLRFVNVISAHVFVVFNVLLFNDLFKLLTLQEDFGVLAITCHGFSN